MGIVVQFPRHARTSAAGWSGATAKSSAVTSLPVTALIATAKSFDSQTLPRRKREIVVRSQEAPVSRTRDAMASSSSFSRTMNSDSCIGSNVRQVHKQVNPACASPGMEPPIVIVHDMHMARAQQQKRQKAPKVKPAPWRLTYLRQWREKAGLSLEAAGAEMHLGHSQLSRIERGLQQYNQNVLETAERLYSTTIWAILYCSPDAPPAAVMAAFNESVKVRPNA